MTEKLIVAIIIHNRFENLRRWLNCWKQCEKRGAELLIIHNYENEPEQLKYQTYCESNDIRYFPRENIGYDIGAFQDVCRERIEGFPHDWTSLLWITDDVIPMSKDFIAPFIFKLQEPGIGISCLEISNEHINHVRTTGFMIRKEIASKLVFPADPVTEKEQCYQFEHRGGEARMIAQIHRMGFKAAAVARIDHSTLWDTGLKRSLRLNRWKEHERVFTQTTGKVTVICPVYQKYPYVITSMLAQTHKNWELLLIHDGPAPAGLKELIWKDDRIHFEETPERRGMWGHYIRSQWIAKMKDRETGYVVVTNADNQLAPVFLEYMLNGFSKNPQAVATYCDKMVHSYQSWNVMDCKPERGHIDCSGVMVKKEVAVDVGWNEIDHHSSDWFYFDGIIKKHGVKSFQPVKGCLLVHN